MVVRGGRLAATLLPEIDEILLKRYPVVLGGGVPLVAGPFAPTAFTPVERTPLSGGVEIVRYVRA